ncbi:MAG: hypothetical protein OEZ06_25315 [Myxococcales bacterium]|nr:hypothetical protein [Myxococcales bacterium]
MIPFTSHSRWIVRGGPQGGGRHASADGRRSKGLSSGRKSLKLLAPQLGTELALWGGAVTAPRSIVPGATTALIRLCTFRKAFLGERHPDVGACWLYSLAQAQLRTQVAIHHATRCVNHHHLNVTPDGNNLPEFIKLLHEDISCSLNTLMARDRYDQPHELFDDRPTHMLQLRDGEAQALHLLYESVNCCSVAIPMSRLRRSRCRFRVALQLPCRVASGAPSPRRRHPPTVRTS